ncbi:MAG: hypothetical protein QMB59_05810, partial [Bacteroidales bacterium]
MAQAACPPRRPKNKVEKDEPDANSASRRFFDNDAGMPYCADHLGLRSENLSLGDVEVSDQNLLSKLERRAVYLDEIRQIVNQTEAAEFANADDQTAAILYAFCTALDLNRNVDGYRLVLSDSEEILVTRLFGD